MHSWPSIDHMPSGLQFGDSASNQLWELGFFNFFYHDYIEIFKLFRFIHAFPLGSATIKSSLNRKGIRKGHCPHIQSPKCDNLEHGCVHPIWGDLRE